VLNEGVDVPSVKIAIILSGTGSTREYVQRLGRILRKSKENTKLAILYEVIAEDTSEESTSQRRKGAVKKFPDQPRQLELLPNKSKPIPLKAAESKQDYQVEQEDN
jgi:superfamily II DNA or RNA helicase